MPQLQPDTSGSPEDAAFVDQTFAPVAQRPSNLGDENDNLIWSMYLKRTEEYDANRLAQWNSDLDVLLIFAALFSAIVTAFVVQSIRDLREDFSKTSSELLRVLVSQSLGQNSSVPLSPNFEPDPSSIIVNSLWFTSFVLSLGTSLGALLIKEWLRCYTARTSSTPDIRMLQRYARFSAFEQWNVAVYIKFLPAILRLSIFLFFAGLCAWLGPIHVTVRNVTAAIISVIGALYVGLTFLPLWTTAPFVTPVTLLVTQFMHKLVDFVLALVYAIFLFSITVIPVAVQERSMASVVKTFKQWTVVVRHSFQRVLHMAGLIMTQEEYEHRESNQAEKLAWLIHNAPNDDSMGQIVQSLSQIQSYESQRVFVKRGVDIMLLNYLLASCFRRYGPGAPWKLIPERTPIALSCFDVLSTITSSTSTTVQNAAWMGFPTDEMVNSLLQATTGHDRLRVLAAAVWLINDHNKSLQYRRDIRQHLMNHINGLDHVPDHIVKGLVDALHPSLDFISASDIMRLLKAYLEQNSLPSYNCLHSILFNLYARGRDSSESPAQRRFGVTHYVAHLLENDEVRSLYLRLIRRMTSSYGSESVVDVDLSKSIFYLLDRVSGLHETQIIDILETISHSPTCCYADDQPLLRLGRFYEVSTSELVSRAAIVAIISFMESVYRTYNPMSDSFDFDVAKETQRVVRAVARKLVVIHSLGAFVNDKEIVSFSIYVFSLASSHVSRAFAHEPVEELLRTLVGFIYIPNSYGEVPIVYHNLQVIRAIVVANRSMGAVLAESTSTWEQLAIDEDPLIRWPSCEILVYASFHLTRDERARVFETVRADIYRRLRSTESRPFVDPNWRTFANVISSSSMGEWVPPPRVAIAQEVLTDLRKSGIIELLDGVSSAMVCEKSPLAPDNFFWLPALYSKAG